MKRVRHRQRHSQTPPPLAGGGWGRGPGAPQPPPPQPPPARGGLGFGQVFFALSSSHFSASCHHSSFCSPPSARRWTTPSRPTSPASVHVGTEVLDRQDRPLALLPAPGGVWRFRAGAAPHAAHQSAHRGRGPPLLVPPRRRSPRPGPRHRADARGPATLSPAARHWRCRPPACSSRDRAPSAPS